MNAINRIVSMLVCGFSSEISVIKVNSCLFNIEKSKFRLYFTGMGLFLTRCLGN